MTIESADARGVIHGKLDVSLGQAPVGGSPIGVVGDITAQRGEVELFDRRYQVDRAEAHFDGSIDPQLDIRITYDFPDVTTVTEIHGRLSKPELALSSEPGIYSQGELLGFLLGGEPNGDTQQSQAQTAAARVSGAGTSLIANQLSGYLKKSLPISVDVIKYEAATSVNSAAVTIGSWLTHTLFLAYREHLDVRPDENESEGDVEYYIKPRVVLQGTAGDRGYDGLDLLWRKRWGEFDPIAGRGEHPGSGCLAWSWPCSSSPRAPPRAGVRSTWTRSRARSTSRRSRSKATTRSRPPI